MGGKNNKYIIVNITATLYEITIKNLTQNQTYQMQNKQLHYNSNNKEYSFNKKWLFQSFFSFTKLDSARIRKNAIATLVKDEKSEKEMLKHASMVFDKIYQSIAASKTKTLRCKKTGTHSVIIAANENNNA